VESVGLSVLVLLAQLLLKRLMRFDETLYKYFNTDLLFEHFFPFSVFRFRFLLIPHIYYVFKFRGNFSTFSN
jgi:hypothetical protein